MYTMINKEQWQGRIDHPTNRVSFRYHQVVEPINIQNIAQSNTPSSTIIGFECEEGVRRNKGRLGAVSAPNAIRNSLSSLPWVLPVDNRLLDAGNIACQGTNLEEAQIELSKAVSKILDNKSTCIVLGGGHETLYGHYLGVRESIGADKKLGIVNIDAHFDLRSYEVEPSSGTMFRQILEQDSETDYFVIGIQRYGNTLELFEKADELGVEYIYEDVLLGDTSQLYLKQLKEFINNHDAVLLTLCTDVLNAAFAPGVSAPSPFGLSPQIVRSIIQFVTSQEKTVSFDICEVNPSLDEDGRTTKLGAYFVNEAIVSFHKGNHRC
ncbi:formimidoylglutamase [Viridibacillus sp. YIM B01967]|uniref:Formimidoylglutamase n=1 Tax=Viridibacillus soli TaxID=2798301 RepID=A0ABS1H234_9BACL|nr:formimidoylglutamase [Viridibacillus soli]MBK3493468.1 formimidoylglutamase [Viridibacillus soli]